MYNELCKSYSQLQFNINRSVPRFLGNMVVKPISELHRQVKIMTTATSWILTYILKAQQLYHQNILSASVELFVPWISSYGKKRPFVQCYIASLPSAMNKTANNNNEHNRIVIVWTKIYTYVYMYVLQKKTDFFDLCNVEKRVLVRS